MKTRILSGIILLPFLTVIYFRGPLLWVAGFFIAIAGLHEFYRGFRKIDIHPSRLIGCISAAALYALVIFGEGLHVYLLWFFAVILLSLLYLSK